MIYTTGFFITSNDEALKKVCAFATEHNKPLAFNIAAVFLLFIAKDSVMHCIEHADFVFCNEDEGSTYAKLHGLEEKDYTGAAKHIAMSKKANNKRPRVAIITQGAEPVTIAISHNGGEATVEFVEVPKIAKEMIVDTNGAGDAFVGAFLAHMAQDKCKSLEADALLKDVIECVHEGIKMSGHVVQRLGCTFD